MRLTSAIAGIEKDLLQTSVGLRSKKRLVSRCGGHAFVSCVRLFAEEKEELISSVPGINIQTHAAQPQPPHAADGLATFSYTKLLHGLYISLTFK